MMDTALRFQNDGPDSCADAPVQYFQRYLTITTEVSPSYFNEGCKNLQKGVDDFSTEGLKLVNDIAFRDNNQELETAA